VVVLFDLPFIERDTQMVEFFPKADDLSRLHDAELFLVQTDRDKSELQLAFKADEKYNYRFIFNGVATYKINNMLYQNVVSSIKISNVNSDVDFDVEYLVRWVCSNSSNDLLISETKLSKYISDIIDGSMNLFYLNPSWGAEIGVIADSIDMISG